MTSAAAGSAHHLSHAFRPMPNRAAAEVKAQKAVSVESAITAGLFMACPVRRLAIARSGMTISAATVTAMPGMEWPGLA